MRGPRSGFAPLALAAFGSTHLAGAPASSTGTSADTAVAAGASGTQIPFVVGLSTVQAVATAGSRLRARVAAKAR
jgi:hypothetical protein